MFGIPRPRRRNPFSTPTLFLLHPATGDQYIECGMNEIKSTTHSYFHAKARGLNGCAAIFIKVNDKVMGCFHKGLVAAHMSAAYIESGSYLAAKEAEKLGQITAIHIICPDDNTGWCARIRDKVGEVNPGLKDKCKYYEYRVCSIFDHSSIKPPGWEGWYNFEMWIGLSGPRSQYGSLQVTKAID
jgi:hypothetical protein